MLRRNLAHKHKTSGQGQGQGHDPFRKALVVSVLLHIAVVLLFSISMPFMQAPPESPERVNVTLVDADEVAERAKAPPEGEAAQEEADKANDTGSAPDSPPKQIEQARPPQAPKVDMSKPPEPDQVEQAKSQQPVPDPAPSKPAPPEPEPEQEPPEPEPEDEQEEDKDNNKTDQAQEQKDQNKQDRAESQKQFQSVLKNLAEPRPEPENTDKDSEEKEEEETKEKTDDSQGLANRAGRITMSEKQALRQQLSKCWNVLAGAKNAENLVVRLRLRMNPDRTVKRAELLDKQRYDNNPQFRAAADSALRAVQNPQCSPLKLPPEKYDQWDVITIRFDPEQML